MSDTPDTPPAKRSPWPIITVAVFGALLLLPLCTYQVRKEQIAITTTFGSYDPDPVTSPGLYWKLPWPIQKVLSFDQRLRVFSSKFTENRTSDEMNLVITFFAVWKIDNPTKFNESAGSIDNAQKVLGNLISAERSVVIAQHPASHLISVDPEEFRFSEIEQEIHQRVATKAHDKYGIEVTQLGIERIGLPESNTQAVFQRMITERENKAKLYRQEGERQAARLRTEANQTRDARLNSARAEAKQIRAKGDSAAAKVYQDYQADPEFALFLRKLEALEEAMGSKKTTLIIDRNVEPFDLLEDATGNYNKSKDGTK